jgi:phage terminase small subunit
MQTWWHAVMARYVLDDHHRYLLQAACEAWDRMTQARRAIAEHGLTYQLGETIRARPEIRIEVENRTSFARIVRDLGIDDAKPPRDPGGLGVTR